jgi:hypothetical protein
MPHTVVPSLRRIALSGLLLITPSLVCATELVRPRPLMEYADILLAQELDVAVTALNDQLQQCVDSGTGTPAECFCRSPKEADAARVSYAKTLQARPKWQGKILYWKNTDTLASRQLVMPALEQQLGASAPACSQPVK